MTPIALTIAGSDSGGGAGIQADLKTFSALGVFGASALTAVTAQNTRGVTDVELLSPRILRAQIEAVLGDLDVAAIKIGMVASAELAATIADTLAGRPQPVVLDPVMVATSGDRLLAADAVSALNERLLPLAAIVTPNLPEAALLTGRAMAEDEGEMTRQAEILLSRGAAAVLMKGGHGRGETSTDLLFDGGAPLRLEAQRVDTRNDHGTGCTLAAALAAGLAKGLSLREAAGEAKLYLTEALRRAGELRVGQGRGPVHHFHAWWPAPRP